MTSRRKPASPSATDKWQLVENIVAALEHIRNDVPGTRIVPKALLPVLADPQDHREVDVYLEVPVGDRTIQIGVEVKERSSRRLDTAQLGSLIDLKEEVGLHCFCVVCTSGFTAAAKRKAERHNIQLVEPDRVQDSGFFPNEDFAFVYEKGPVALNTLMLFDPTTPPAELQRFHALLVTAAPDDLLLIDRDGAHVPVHRVTTFEGNRAVEMLDPRPTNGERFQAKVLDVPSRFAALQVSGHRFPAPNALVVDFEYVHRPTKHFKFRLFGFDVAAYVEQTPSGPMQVTMVAIPAPEAPGCYRISLQRNPLSPPKTLIDRKSPATHGTSKADSRAGATTKNGGRKKSVARKKR